ncbi:MAG: hypothetical protein AAF830_15895, partial [Pseudomonadota bacterium]
ANATASYTVFTDRTAFTAALVGTYETEDFNDVLVDTFFVNDAVQFDHFSVGYSGTLRFPTFNLVDAATPTSGSVGLNNPFGSSAVVGGVNPGEAVSFMFNSPVYAFGGDWAEINDRDIIRRQDVQRSVFEVNDETFDAPLNFSGFWGVVSEDPFDTFQVVGLGATEGFGLDDAVFADAEDIMGNVPIPAAGALFAGALALLRRKRG